MIKKIVQKKSSKISLKKTKDIELSIQFSLDGFSFCVLDSKTKRTLYFTQYLFKHTLNSPEDLLKKIQSIFKTDEILQKEFTSVTAFHQNDLSTLVPNTFFNKDSVATYLNYNIRTLKTDFITFDDLTTIEAKNVYIPYVNINNYLFQNFGEFEYKHHKTILLEKLIAQDNSNNKTMYINVNNSFFDIVILENKKLIFSNSFSYDTKEDFIYYVLFTAEQNQLNTEQFNVYFTGEITLKSEIYKITYTYIKNVFFLESNNSIFKDLEIENHSNFILLG